MSLDAWDDAELDGVDLDDGELDGAASDDAAADDAHVPEGPGSRDAEWVAALTARGAVRAQAMAELHGLMLRAAAHQVWRMSGQLAGLDRQSIDVLINQSADEAMVSVIRKLATFEGRSRFSTWAYKFAVLQAASDVHRTVWRDREVTLDDGLEMPDRGPTPDEHAEAADLQHALRSAIATALTPHQRRIVVALLIEHVPIDVVADRLDTNRNALYKTLHDARTRLRRHLITAGHLPALTADPKAPVPHILEGERG